MNNSTLNPIKTTILTLLVVAIIAMLSILPRISQPDTYMQFADTRTLFNIPNFGDVVSNLLFIALGLLGLIRPGYYSSNFERHVYQLFFIGVLSVCFGSAYFHWQPNYWSLLWDRLPISIAMMSFLTGMIGERLSERLAKICWMPLLLLGIFSIFYWYVTEINGHGDLRPYLFTQLFPAIFIPALLILYPKEQSKTLWLALGAYLIARVTEYFDHTIYMATRDIISGHTLKHIFMAIGILFIYLYKRKQHVRTNNL